MLHAGLAKADITPPVGIHLAGYAARTEPSRKVGFPLYAKAAVFEAGGQVAAIVATDLLCVTDAITREVRRGVREQTAIPQDHVLLCATHTHSGPLLEHMSSVEDEVVDSEWIQGVLVTRVVQAVREAYASRRPAEIRSGHCDAHGANYNRRLIRADGTIATVFELCRKDPAAFLGWQFGPTDPQLKVLSICSGGSPRGLIVNFSCHPTCNDFGTQAISADFPGPLTAQLEAKTGGVCLHTTSCSAETVASVRNSTFMASALSRAAMSVIESSQRQAPTPAAAVWARRKMIRLPLRMMPTVAQARERFDRDTAAKSDQRFLARRWLMYAEMYEGQTHLDTEMQVIGIGNVAFIGLPGEVSVEIGLTMKELIRRQWPHIDPYLVTQANSWTGEAMLDHVYEDGGSESRTTRLGPGCRAALLDDVADLLGGCP